MFWKKLSSSSTSPTTSNAPNQNLLPKMAGNLMTGSLQKKFSKGVNYNMKIIIKGDRNVGKTCLFARLQGGQFIEKYIPTEEIQVTSIQWSFKATEDIVKVEVWDVVDKGKPRTKSSGLKLTTNSLPEETPALDATFLDVYKGTHGVILIMDVTKTWTFDYVVKELPKIPPEIPILILGNHCDMSHHRVVSQGQAQDFVDSFIDCRLAEVLYSESSMRNGFGLRLLHKFLGLPFLRLQRETFLALIERNKSDTKICSLEINEYLNSEDADYNKFLDRLSDKRRQVADSNSKTPTTSFIPTPSLSSNNLKSPETLKCHKSIIVGGGKPIIVPGQINITQQINRNVDTSTADSIKMHSTLNQASAIVSHISNQNDVAQQQSLKTQNTEKKINLDEFCPDENLTLDRNFLEDIVPISTTMTSYNDFNDSDSETSNPMVMKFYEDDDDEPEETTPENKNAKLDSSKKINPLSKNKSNSFTGSFRKISISSEEIITNPLSFNNLDENSDCWMPDQQRRSPEGGEDLLPIKNIVDLTPKEPDSSCGEDKKVKKKKDKKHKIERKEKKKKRKSKTDDLEQFLNGEDSTKHPVEDYEAI